MSGIRNTDQWYPLPRLYIQPEDDRFHILQTQYLERFDNSHYTRYELDMCISGIRDAEHTSHTSPALRNNHPFYWAGFRLFLSCTSLQQEILILYVISGLSQNEIKNLKNYQSHNTVPSHLRGIKKKTSLPQEDPQEERIIIDPYTERYEDESVEEWFERINS